MNPPDIFDESEILAEELMEAIDRPLFDDSDRIVVSDVACSLSLEHWHATRVLLSSALLPSALVVHRAQFEAITRSIWLTYAASDLDVSKLTADLTLESEQAAKNMPQLLQMMETLKQKAPATAYDALSRFKENSWKALNSYTHAGIHSIQRHRNGYPLQLIHDVLRNANGLAVFSCMQAVVLSGEQPLQRLILDIAGKHLMCMPQLL